MKKIFFTLLFFIGLYSNAARLQIDFNNGFEINVVTDNSPMSSIGTTTSNSEINAIFSFHNAGDCFGTYGNGYHIIFVDYSGSNLNGLITDLEANPNVNKVRICVNQTDWYYYADRLYVKLVTATDGNPTGTNGNQNIVTTNNLLNTIFDDHDVTAMDYLIPLVYEIYFDGDITSLYNALNDLDSVIEYAELNSVAMLNTSEFEWNKPKIFPNPFSGNFLIETDEIISNYSLYDVCGKQLANTDSKTNLDTAASQLNPGIYILNLQFEEGKTANYKLVKK